MSKYVEMQYGVVFGKLDASDWIPYDFELTDEEEAIYDKAVRLHIPPDEVDELEGARQRAYEEIEEMELDNCREYGDEYALECLGEVPVDADEINQLVADRDPHTLEFFGLTDLSDEELEEWDANDLDELPNVCDFQEGFEPESPYDNGWTLNIEFIDPNEDSEVSEDEAKALLHELFSEANGDYSDIREYLERIEYQYEGDMELYDLAQSVADELGITHFEPEE